MMNQNALSLSLPWPPSINHYWRHTKHGHYISQEGKNYRTFVHYECLQYPVKFEASARLSMLIDAYPPDRRKRDLDNVLKSLLDALQHTGIYGDDSQIDYLMIKRHSPLEGRVLVTLGVL